MVKEEHGSDDVSTASAPVAATVLPPSAPPPTVTPVTAPAQPVAPVVSSAIEDAVKDAVDETIAKSQKVIEKELSDPEYTAMLKLSREIIEKIAWEVVPQLAEVIIKEVLAKDKKIR
ncbi:MAG: hypothetical protein JXR95_07920 [Deltaproteobacteria bacterium]|nr:hypothetical protein [Deltaproteobacteria bacterium]